MDGRTWRKASGFSHCFFKIKDNITNGWSCMHAISSPIDWNRCLFDWYDFIDNSKYTYRLDNGYLYGQGMAISPRRDRLK